MRKGFVVALVQAALLAGGVGVTVYGLLTSGILHDEIWLPAFSGQVVRLFVAVAAVAAITRALRWRARLVCVIAGGLLVASAFGVAAAAAAGYLLLAALATGSLWLYGRGTILHPDLADVPLAILIGLATLVATVSIIVAAPVNTPTLYLALLAVPLGAGRRHLGVWLTEFRTWVADTSRSSHVTYWLGTAVFALLTLHLLCAAMPERYHDALGMHLYVPSFVASHARWTFDVSSYVWAVMPLGGDWLYTVGYLFAGEPGAKLFAVVLFLVTVLLLWHELRKSVEAAVALVALALLASLPLAFIESSSLFVEHAVSAFVLAAYVLTLRALREPSIRNVTVAFFLFGIAMASKLHAALAVAPLGLLLAIEGIRRVEPRRRLAALALGTVVTLVALHPYLNAWARTGNPVFPYFNTIFKSPQYLLEAAVDDRWPGLDPRAIYAMTFDSGKYLEGTRGAFGFHLLAFGLAGAWAVASRGNRALRLVLVVSLVYVAGVSVNIQYLRYYYPVIPLGMLAIAYGIASPTPSWRWWRPAGIALGIAAAVLNVMYLPTAGWILGLNDLRAAWSAPARAQMIREQASERLLIEMVNATPIVEPRVAFFGGPNGAGLRGDAVYGDWYNWRFHDEATGAESADALAAALARRRVDFAIVNDESLPEFRSLPGFLDSSATIVGRAGRAALYRLSPTVRYHTELLKNGGFEDGLTNWILEDTDESKVLVGRTVRLEKPSALVQKVEEKVVGGTGYYYRARLQCEAASDLRVQVHWESDKEFAGTDAYLVTCDRAGLMEREAYFVAPPGVTRMVAYLVMVGGGPINVQSVSLRKDDGVQSR